MTKNKGANVNVEEVEDVVRKKTGAFIQNIPVILSVGSMFCGCLMFISGLNAKVERVTEKLESVRVEVRDVEVRVNHRVDESNAMQDRQYQMIRQDLKEVGGKLDRILMNKQLGG